MLDDVIWIVTEEPPQLPQDGVRGGQSTNPFGEPGFTGAPHIKRTPVRIEALEQSMTDLLQRIGRVLSHAKQRAGELAGMELDEIELSVEINGEGQVSLLGSGAKAGSKGTMTLKFKMK